MDERYPIGRFQAPETLDAEARRGWMESLRHAPARLREAVAGLTDAQLDTPYREGGWSVRQVVHHLADSHSVAYGRFRFTLIEDSPTFQPYDERRLAALPDAMGGPVAPSLELLSGLHERWTMLLDAMTEADFERSFLHPERGRVTLAQQLARSSWHVRHHTAQIVGLRQREGW